VSFGSFVVDAENVLAVEIVIEVVSLPLHRVGTLMLLVV